MNIRTRDSLSLSLTLSVYFLKTSRRLETGADLRFQSLKRSVSEEEEEEE